MAGHSKKLTAWIGAGVAALALSVIAGCSASSNATAMSTAAAGSSAQAFSGNAGGDAAAPAAAPPDKGTPARAGADTGTGAASGASLPALDNRQIVRTADFQIALTVAADVADDALAQAERDAVDAAVANARAQALAV